MKHSNLYDLTLDITPNIMLFPGDPDIKIETHLDINKGDICTVHHLQFSNHTGTHIDFPAHLIKNGACSSDYSLEFLSGHGQIAEIPDDGHVTLEHINALEVHPGDIVFFKTSNTRQQLLSKPFTEQFSALTLEAASALVDKGIKMVGIDYLSIDQYNASSLPVHKTLLSHGILIVENLKLDNVPAGRYHITVAPLKVKNLDGLPVRVFCQAQ